MKIALVEDETRFAEILKEGLESDDHEVDIFPTAATARSGIAYSGSLYDLILLDLMLPDGDGADVCSELRATGVASPVLVITARDSTEDKVTLLDRGADDFLTKPFDFDELLARGRALTRRAQEKTPARIRIAGLTLVPERYEVKSGGAVIRLTAREFELFLYLARAKGRVVSREELLAKIWHQAPGATNVVDVHVRKLRKKLDPYAKGLIETVHGIGYAITA